MFSSVRFDGDTPRAYTRGNRNAEALREFVRQVRRDTML
jgi:hypothetical protein